MHLLLLHGAIGSSSQLNPLAELLKDQYTIHNLDFPGHGGSTTDSEFSIELFAGYVSDYCAKNNIANAGIFGYSMGGYVAFYLAKKYPWLVRGLITLATKFHWNIDIAEKETRMLQPEVIETKVPKFASTLQQRHAPSDWKLVLNKTADMLASLGKNNLLKPEDYSTILTPSLLMLGDRDKMVTHEETVDVFKILPSGSLAILPATPHPIEQVDPSLVSFFIRKFFN